MAGEAQPAALGIAQTHALNGCDVLARWLATHAGWPTRTPGLADADVRQTQVRRTDLDARAHLIAYAAVEAGCPPAVLDTFLFECVLPVLPEPFAIESRVQVIPRAAPRHARAHAW